MRGVRWTALTVVLVLVLAVFSRGAARADEISKRTNATDILVNPLLFFLLHEDEAAHSKDTLLMVDDLRFQTTIGTGGNLNNVAQYRPLDTSVNVTGLFYQRAFGNDLVQLLMTTDGFNSSRIDARVDHPNSYKARVRDIQVLHRLNHDSKGVEADLTPTARYERTWHSTELDASASFTKNGNVGVYGGYWTQNRSTQDAHSFYQLHRGNCTECHTVAAGRSVGMKTNDYYAGARGSLDWQGLTFDARFKTSQWGGTGPQQSWNFGGSLGNSLLYNTANGRDNSQEYRLYAGQGGPYRFGAHLVNLDRRSGTSGGTMRGNYVSVQAAGNPLDRLQVSAGYNGQKEDYSFQTNLSSNRQSLYMQADYNPMRGLNFSGRMGMDDREYRRQGLNAQTASNTYYSLRAAYRPVSSVRLEACFRNDHTDHPFFATDLQNKATFYAQGLYSRNGFTAGLRFNSVHGSNAWNDFKQDEFAIFASAQIKRATLNLAYTTTSTDANNAYTYYYPMPQATSAQLSPGPGFPLFLQSGFPYTARNNQFQASLTLPLGGKKPFIFSPTYRQALTQTYANYLPTLPGVASDSQLRVLQNAWGLRLDFPVWNVNERMGLGWEQSRWSDQITAGNTGSYDIFTINYSKKL